jgi:hypothetical protein
VESNFGKNGAPKRSPKPDFQRRLTHIIAPTGGPRAELVTLADAARFIGLMRPWCQTKPVWDYETELLLTAATKASARTSKQPQLGSSGRCGPGNWL